MLENVRPADLTRLLQEGVRDLAIESKYNDENLSLGEAVVTQHFYELLKQGKIAEMP
jgi:hypothetical protein